MVGGPGLAGPQGGRAETPACGGRCVDADADPDADDNVFPIKWLAILGISWMFAYKICSLVK
jgi:hypothetical protein